MDGRGPVADRSGPGLGSGLGSGCAAAASARKALRPPFALPSNPSGRAGGRHSGAERSGKVRAGADAPPRLASPCLLALVLRAGRSRQARPASVDAAPAIAHARLGRFCILARGHGRSARCLPLAAGAQPLSYRARARNAGAAVGAEPTRCVASTPEEEDRGSKRETLRPRPTPSATGCARRFAASRAGLFASIVRISEASYDTSAGYRPLACRPSPPPPPCVQAALFTATTTRDQYRTL
jgi:hypothetical protein